jgi:hypothetical protein
MDFTVLILRISMMFQPLKIFLPLAFLFLTAGLLKSIFDIWALWYRNVRVDLSILFYPALSTSAILLILTGLQLLFIGMLADAIVRKIMQQSTTTVPSMGILAPELVADGEKKSC